MSKNILLTAAGPSMRPLLEQYSLPTFHKYAETFGYDVHVESIQEDGGEHTDPRHKTARFQKLSIIRKTLSETDAEFVVWLDADAMICRYETNITDGVSTECFQGLSLDWVPTLRRLNPNTGVWVLRNCPETFLFLDAVETANGQPGPWADQASVMKALGWLWDNDSDYAGARPGSGSAFLDHTSWLGEGWNQPDFTAERCVDNWDGRPMVSSPHIVHFMGMFLEERTKKMAALSRQLKTAESLESSAVEV